MSQLLRGQQVRRSILPGLTQLQQLQQLKQHKQAHAMTFLSLGLGLLPAALGGGSGSGSPGPGQHNDQHLSSADAEVSAARLAWL